MKRKEREYEHEMERLAKEKIAAQNRILFLKRELAQWDVDFSKLLPEQSDINAVKSERNGRTRKPESFRVFLKQFFPSFLEPIMTDTSYKSGGLVFSPSPSLSSIITTCSVRILKPY